MSSNAERLVRMANQIARNFAVMGDDEAAKATADHIDKFWDPRMREQAFALLGEDDGGFSAPAREALEMLASGTQPEA